MNIPICNTETEEIIGCTTEQDLKHEKNHIDFSKTERGMQMAYFSQLSEFWIIIFLITTNFIPIFKWFALVTGIIYLYLWIYEEVYCDKKS